MVAYATRADVYREGLQRGALTERAREIASVDVAASTLELAGHGCETDEPIFFTVSPRGVLPAPLVAGVPYFAIPVTSSTFKVAETEGGIPVVLTTSGTAPFNMGVDGEGEALDVLLEYYSRLIDGIAVGHQVPFTAPFPKVVTHAVAVQTAAFAMRKAKRGEQAAGTIANAEEIRENLARLLRGLSLRDPDATPPSNLAAGRTPSISRNRQVLP